MTAGDSENNDFPWPEEQRHGFDFFQIARLLYRSLNGTDEKSSLRDLVDLDSHPEAEKFRFRTSQSLSHQSSEVKLDGTDGKDSAGQLEVLVNFIGLTGTAGVLPHHYTEMVCERIRKNDFAMRDFFDLFNHRVIALFFRSWLKYRLPFSFELGCRGTPGNDPITRILYSLVGLESEGLKGRFEFSDFLGVFYSGAFAAGQPNCVLLENILNDHFGIPARLIQFFPDTLLIDPEDQLHLGKPGGLGQTTILGARITSFENRFRVVLGPCTSEEFEKLLPDGKDLKGMAQFIRTQVGIDYDFDIQILLRKEDVPELQLGATGGQSARLGWNTWVRSREVSEDVDDVVFQLDGAPSR